MARSIYVVKSETGPVKVGIANNVMVRLSHLQTSSPYNLHMHYAMSGNGDMLELERRAHAFLRQRRMSGEWFDTTVAEAIEAVTRSARELDIDLIPISAGAKKSRGRPTVDSEAVNVRMERLLISAIDAWISSQPDPKPSRPEAIRRLVDVGLRHL